MVKPAAKAQRVALSYETAKDLQYLTVRSVGFCLSLGRRFKLKQVGDTDVCEAELTYAGHAFRFRVDECHSTKPELRLDLTGTTNWEEADSSWHHPTPSPGVEGLPGLVRRVRPDRSGRAARRGRVAASRPDS